MGPGLSRRAHPRPDRPLRRRRPDRRRDAPDPVRRFAARAARHHPAARGSASPGDRRRHHDRVTDQRLAGRVRPEQPRAAPHSTRGSTGSCATSSTTTWARWPATTSAARSRGCCCASCLDDPNSAWWDDSRTPGVTETSDVIIARAMDEAGAELRAAFGSPDGWSWGRVHTATFREATLGTSGIGPLEWYFNEGPRAVPGTAGAVNNTYFRFSSAYPDPTDPDYRPGRHRPRLRHDQHAELSTDDRHARPRWRPAHHHDGPVGQPVRSPLQRPDRAVDRRRAPSRCRSRRPRSRQPAASTLTLTP